MEEGEVIEHRWLTQGDRERAEAGRRPQLRHPQEPARVRRRDEPAAARPSTSCAAGCWPPARACRWSSTTRTRRPRRRSAASDVISWADFREMVLDALEDVIVALTGHLRAGARTRTPGTSTALPAAVKENFNLEMSFAGHGQPRGAPGADLPGGGEGPDAAREGVRRGVPALRAVPVPRDHRPAVEGPPAGDGPPAPGHRPARLRPEGSEAGVQEGGLRGLHADARGHQAPVRQPADASAGARAQAEETARLQRQMRPAQRQCVEGRADAEGQSGEGRAAPRAPRRRPGAKVGRNDPCPCGSGKKYKKCHGLQVA